MVLWTIQPESVYRQIIETGSYHFDPEKSALYSDFRDAYFWMEIEMRKRGIVPSSASGATEPLVWAWHTWDGKWQVPEYQDEVFHIDGKEEKPVCLEIEVPDENVLLSDFNAWHFVLNDSYLDDSHNEEEFEKMHAEFDALSLKEKEEKKRASWQSIFDVSQYTIGNGWRTNGFYVQAVFYGLKKEQIRHVYGGIDYGERRKA